MSLIDALSTYRLLPALILDDVGMAKDVAGALKAGDLPVLEVTLRTPNALRVLAELAHDSTLWLGAGTVLNIDQAKAARDVGARYLVSPGMNMEVAEFAQAEDLPYIPGAVTATEMMLAMDLGCPVIKFFPAEAMGGLKTLQALTSPLPGLGFIPTGGINAANLTTYLSFNKVLAVGGSWMVAPHLLKARNFAEITRLSKEARALANTSPKADLPN